MSLEALKEYILSNKPLAILANEGHDKRIAEELSKPASAGEKDRVPSVTEVKSIFAKYYKDVKGSLPVLVLFLDSLSDPNVLLAIGSELPAAAESDWNDITTTSVTVGETIYGEVVTHEIVSKALYSERPDGKVGQIEIPKGEPEGETDIKGGAK
jgi:hypothetical protein